MVVIVVMVGPNQQLLVLMQSESHSQSVCHLRARGNQGWAQGSFVKAEAERSRQSRGKACPYQAMAEAVSSRLRQGRLNSRQGRGEAVKSTLIDNVSF